MRLEVLKTRFHLYTVPGQVFYEASRKLILRGVDGVIFVADSQIERLEDNIDSLKNLKDNLDELGYDFNSLPIVIQWNKRDLPNVIAVEEMENKLNKEKKPSFEAIATTGEGVFDALKVVSKLVLLNIKGGLN